MTTVPPLKVVRELTREATQSVSMVRMIPYADVDLQSVRALAHPLRLRILAVLGDRTLTASQLASELESEPRNVTYHARKLERLGFVTRTERARTGEVRYRLVNSSHFPDQVWARTPTTAKRDVVGAGLLNLHAAAAAALAEGGFDREDMHFTRTAMELDAEGWSQLSREMLGWLDRIDEIRDCAAARLNEGAPRLTHATATMMLFETALTQRTHDPEEIEPEETFTEEEGLERAFELSEALEELLVRPNPPWPKVVALVDQLRVIARVVMAEQDAALAPADDS